MAFPLSYAEFIVRFADFSQTDAAFVQAKLDAAERSIDSTVWGDLAEDGHGNLAAHLITMSPLGRDARVLTQNGASSIYGEEHLRLSKVVGRSYRLVLD